MVTDRTVGKEAALVVVVVAAEGEGCGEGRARGCGESTRWRLDAKKAEALIDC